MRFTKESTMSSDFGLTTRWLDRIKRMKMKHGLNPIGFFKSANFLNSQIDERQRSDSQLTKYEEILEKAAHSNFHFKRFRKNFYYRQIVETVTPDLGFEYIKKINDLGPNFLKLSGQQKYFDNIGNPLTYKYPDVGRISPTTLRYIAVALDLHELFGNLNNRLIVEIGVGYGGQFKVLDKMYALKKYYLFDLPLAQLVAKKYLASFSVKTECIFPEIDKWDKATRIDLVISNYAFSELPRETQYLYLDNIILHSKNGYMTMNTGRGNLSGRKRNQLELDELLEKIPNSRIIEEVPKTNVDNYIIIW